MADQPRKSRKKKLVEAAVPAPAPESAPAGQAAPPPVLHIPYVRCSYCGQIMAATEKQCSRCGRPLLAATPTPAPGVAPVASARLVVLAGPERGQTFVIQAEARVGRGVGNDVVLSDPRASRRHGQITRQGNHYVLVDLGSSYGTLVNDRRVEGGCVLKEGDIIKLGVTELEFHVEEETLLSRRKP